MTHLQVRRPKFDFTRDVPFMWNPGNPAFSFNMNATSMIAIGFEQMIVAAVQEAKPRIIDPNVAEEATAFLRQEAQHSSSHRKHVNALIARHPGLEETFHAVLAAFDEVTATKSVEYRLAYVADLEATFTPSFKLMLDNADTLFRPGDDRVASLFLWHFVEELEHRSSALAIYDEVVGKPWYRIRVLPAVIKHLLKVMSIVAEGTNAHVGLEDRKVDARTLLPTFGIRQSFHRHLPFGWGRSAVESPPSMPGVPLKEKLYASGRVLLSQTPFHKPEHEPLPRFADEWFARWDDGGDVVHWYSAKAIG
jgi:predicted metal-dependent hydrolase